MILVTGATGTVGSEVLASLLPDHTSEVRALTRNANAVFPAGVEKVVGDLGSGDMESPLRGVEAVFLLTDGLHIADHERRLATAATQAGVQRIVKLSALSVGHRCTNPITTAHRAGEEAIRATGLGWTFLRPTAFMSNALNWAATVASAQTVYAPFAGGRTAVVDPADIGAVAAACLTQDGHDHRIYELTGPEPLTPSDQVAVLSRVLGRTLSYVEADPAAVADQMASYRMPAALAHAVVELLRASQEPFNSHPTSDITTVTGRPARTFFDWADGHRATFLDPPTTW